MIEIGLRYGCDMVEILDMAEILLKFGWDRAEICDMVEILDMAEIFLMYSPESDLFEEIGPILVT